MTAPTPVPIAIRALMTRSTTKADTGIPTPGMPRRTAEPWPTSVLTLDTETTTDRSQRLLFGCWRYSRWTPSGTLHCVQEGLFHADELPAEDPAGFAELRRYTAKHRIPLCSRRKFVDGVLYRAAWDSRCLVVGFNLPFDISRIAVSSGEARGRYYGGFSFALWEYWDKRSHTWREHAYKPRICVKHIDSKRAFIGFSRPKRADQDTRKAAFRGYFLDLKTLAFALTSRGHSLKSACAAFAVEHGKTDTAEHGRITPAYIDYCRRDVLASEELLIKLRADFDRHPIALAPWKAFSPASVSKAYLRAMGITSPREKFRNIPRKVLGYFMSAYFGGRAECRIRKTAVPVVYVDFLSMYPTVNSLMQFWRILTAESVAAVDATAEVLALLGSITVDACLDPALWRQLAFVAEVEPNGHILPLRAKYSLASDAYNIGVNHVYSERALWYTGPDLVASVLLHGRAPRIRRAIRLVPQGQQAGLMPVRLGGTIAVDPRTQDLFRTLIEERKRAQRDTELPPEERKRADLALKTFANSGSYGIFAEMNRDELRPGVSEAVQIEGLEGPFESETSAPEDTGEYFFPPLAALIPAAARLMLALLERKIRDLGGLYAMCDTDSMAIVATEQGGLVPCEGGNDDSSDRVPAIRALTWAQVDSIVRDFERLNPYDPSAVTGSILKIEDVNFDPDRTQRALSAYVVSAKRYALFTWQHGRPEIVKYSEHGLGHYLNPTDLASSDRDWIRQFWERLVTAELGFGAGDAHMD